MLSILSGSTVSPQHLTPDRLTTQVSCIIAPLTPHLRPFPSTLLHNCRKSRVVWPWAASRQAVAYYRRQCDKYLPYQAVTLLPHAGGESAHPFKTLSEPIGMQWELLCFINSILSITFHLFWSIYYSRITSWTCAILLYYSPLARTFKGE